MEWIAEHSADRGPEFTLTRHEVQAKRSVDTRCAVRGICEYENEVSPSQKPVGGGPQRC